MKTAKSKNIFKVFGAWLKERIRKFFVALKKNPQAIPLVMLCASFLQYSLNLTDISNTTNKLMTPIKLTFPPFSMEDPFKIPMGLFQFITMLLLILSFVCMLNAFPKRQKPKVPMVLLMLAIYGIVIGADICYLTCITNGLVGTNFTVEVLTFIYNAYNTVLINIILVAVTVVLVILEPVIAKLLRKIKTSIDVEGSGDIGTIDIVDED